MSDFVEVIQNEARLEALRRTSLFDSPPEEAFDWLTRMATNVLRVPVSLVNLVGSDRQYFKSQCGLGEPFAHWRHNPLTYSFCKYVVGLGAPLVVADAREDPRFARWPTVLELGVISYAGVPLITSDGHAIGTFAVVDLRPHEWTEEDIDVLQVLGTCTMSEIDLRKHVDELRDLSTNLQGLVESRTFELRTAEERQRVLLDVNNAIVTCLNRDSLLSATATALAGAIPFDRASLVLYDPNQDTSRRSG